MSYVARRPAQYGYIYYECDKSESPVWVNSISQATLFENKTDALKSADPNDQYDIDIIKIQ